MGVCDAWFAESLLCAVDRRCDVMLGMEPRRTSDAFLWGREVYLWLTRCCFCSGWRWQPDHRAQDTRGSFWFGQRRFDDCFGLGKMCCHCFGAGLLWESGACAVD
jgi:hypothetical protein